MTHELSPQNKQYLERIVAGGLFASKQAALDAAVAALRERTESVAGVPEEHAEAVALGIEQADAGLSTLMTEEDWAGLRQRARDVGVRRMPSDA